MLSSKSRFEELLKLAPEWRPIVENADGAPVSRDGDPLYVVFERLGAKSLYGKALQLGPGNKEYMRLLRDHYYFPLIHKMLLSNQNLKRFLIARRFSQADQRQEAMSKAVELASKMLLALTAQVTEKSEDGFKTLLPAYLQRSVHNFVIDHIKEESEWEKETLQDVNLNPELDDPRTLAADDPSYRPENVVLSGEKVSQLGQLREKLEKLFVLSKQDATISPEALSVVDCIFGLGLTEHSKLGQDMSMKDCCAKLKLKGDTQARQIARCQVLLDKGLDIIRQSVRTELPGVAERWQTELNVNTASRRELTQLLSLTEGEVDRLVANRQYYFMDDLIERGVLKADRLPAVVGHGAVAAFVPIDLNCCTTRTMIDVLGLDKEAAQTLTNKRPFKSLHEIVELKLLKPESLDHLKARGATAR